MRRSVYWVITLLMASSFISLFFEPAEVSASVLFADDFADLNGWTYTNGVWSASGGVLQGQASAKEGSLIWAGDTSWMNYRVTANIRDVSALEATLVVRYKDSDNFYFMGVGCWAHKFSISKIVDGVFEELAYSGLRSEVELGSWYSVTGVADFDTLQLFVDGVKVLEARDDSHLSGAIGFRTWNGTMQAMELVVQSSEAALVSKVAAPTFSPPAGAYSSSQNVALSCSTSGATIRYTTDGSEPTSSSTMYSTPIQISSTTTVKAKAFKSDITDSDSASAAYTINPQKVSSCVFNPVGANYMDTQNVTISCSTEGATIRYTLDGSYPISSSAKYSGPVTISEGTVTVTAKAYKAGMTDSDVAAATYIIAPLIPEFLSVTMLAVLMTGAFILTAVFNKQKK